MNELIRRATDALDAALALPAGHPGRAAHPQGTRGRRDDDLRRLRMRRRRELAISIAHAVVRARLDAAVKVRPDDEHLADLRRVWIASNPCWKPGESEAESWRRRQDAK